MSPKRIKREKAKPEFTSKELEYLDPHYIVSRNILKMHKERNRLAKKRRVDYVV